MVLKFGGTSVGDPDAFERVAGVVRAHGGARPVIVVSAMSKATDTLLAAADSAEKRRFTPVRAAIDRLLLRHQEVATRLLAPAAAKDFEFHLAAARTDLHRLLRRAGIKSAAKARAVIRDDIAAWGERLSATLLTAVLTARGLPAEYVDARTCIVTDEAFGRAAPLYKETNSRTKAQLGPVMRKGRIPVMGGFIAATAKGVTTTLGRGGGDFSAAIVGAALGAAEIQIWTDVHGVLTADPRIVTHARTIPRLSYAEAAELAYFGAKVLHPSTILPALERKIPVRICDSREPNGPGTLVTAEADIWPETVKAIAHKRGISIVQVTSARMLGAYGFLKALFDVFDHHQVAVDVVTTSEVSVSLSV
ncbi:MAG TPA: aspartate kinase, partial [Gemmatimonadales bacterium]